MSFRTVGFAGEFDWVVKQKKKRKKKKEKKKKKREKKANLSRGIVGFGCDDLIFCLVSCRFLERTSLHLENGHILIQYIQEI